jgi:hypothetical protein
MEIDLRASLWRLWQMRYPTWLKRLLLPFEFEDHPLHAKEPEPEIDDTDGAMDGLRHVLGDEFADRIAKF